MPEPIIRDFDKVVRQQRIAILAGEEIDVTMIPSGVMADLLNTMEGLDKKDPKNFGMMVDMVAKICQVKNKKITSQWLYDNTDIETLLELANFVMEPAKQKAAEVEGKHGNEKNG